MPTSNTGISPNWDNPEVHNWHTKFLIGTLLKTVKKAFQRNICTFGIFGSNIIFQVMLNNIFLLFIFLKIF